MYLSIFFSEFIGLFELKFLCGVYKFDIVLGHLIKMATPIMVKQNILREKSLAIYFKDS